MRPFPIRYKLTPYLKSEIYFIIKTYNIWIPETGKKLFFSRYVHKYYIYNLKCNAKYLDMLKRCAVININYLHKLKTKKFFHNNIEILC